MVVVWSMEGVGCGRDRMSGRKIGLIGVIPHVKNGGCMEMEGVSDLGQAVGTNVSVGQGVDGECHSQVVMKMVSS